MSHFGAIGFSLADRKAFQEMVTGLLDQSTEDFPQIAAPQHPRWRDPSGASLAFHVEDDTIACITPFFDPPDGLTRWHVRTAVPTIDPECRYCSGADCDLLDSAGELASRAGIQWLQFAPYADWLGEPRTYALEVVGFAEAALCAPTEDEFFRAQTQVWRTGNLSSNAFMPLGLFNREPGSMGQRAVALAAGRVEQSEVVTNQATGGRFHRLRIATLPGSLDVVTEACDGDPAVGTFALVQCWLVGRPVNPPLFTRSG